MKFSVEVETECRTYSRAGYDSPAPRQLQWAIDVSIQQKLNHVLPESADQGGGGGAAAAAGRWSQTAAPTQTDTPARAKKVGVVEGRPRVEEQHKLAGDRAIKQEEQGSKRAGQENRSEGEEGGRQRKMSRLEREEELIRRAMRKTSRKVSREGQWLVIREKTGVLTTQNGTQQIREKRVRITEEELVKLEELGY